LEAGDPFDVIMGGVASGCEVISEGASVETSEGESVVFGVFTELSSGVKGGKLTSCDFSVVASTEISVVLSCGVEVVLGLPPWEL
jgi:hypothetical protein